MRMGTAIAGMLAATLLAPWCRGETIVPKSAASDITAGADAEPSSLRWHEDNGRAFLSIGDMDRTRRVIVDPTALHRVPLARVGQPRYRIELGEGVTVSNGWFVLFDAWRAGPEIMTREVTLLPTDGTRLARVDLSDARKDRATWREDGGGIVVSLQSRTPAPMEELVMDCAFSIDAVYAAEKNELDEVNDLTAGDVSIIDTVGATTIGTIRRWTLDQLDGHRGDDWSRHPAASEVRLNSHAVYMDSLQRFHSGLNTTEVEQDTWELYAGVAPVLSVVADVSTNGASGLRIMDFRLTDIDSTESVDVWCTDVGSGHVVQGIDTLASRAWRDLATVDLGGETVDGIACRRLRVTTGGARFFRVRASIDGGHGTTAIFHVPLDARGGIILTSPNGSRWRLKVDDSGTLSTEAAQ